MPQPSEPVGIGSDGNQLTAPDEKLLRLIYEGALEERPWLGLLRELRRRLDCSHANIAFHRKTGAGAWVESVVDADTTDIPVSPEYYLTRYAALDPIPYHTLVPGRVYAKHELWDAANVFYREFLQPQGIDELAILLIEEPDGMRAWLTLARRTPGPPFSAAECESIRAVTPHFSVALRIFSALKSAATERDVYKEAFGSFSIGTLLIDQSGHVTRADAVAARILDRNPALSIHDARLRAKDRGADTELQDSIASALRESSAAAPNFSRAMRLPGHGNLSLLVRSIAAGASSTNEKTAAAVVYLSDTQSEGTASAQKLMDLFELSAMEAALAMQLARGRTLAEAAIVLNLSEQTARTYSKHIFAKTGTHRQAELVRLILTSVAHLAT